MATGPDKKPIKLSEKELGLVVESIFTFDFRNWNVLAGPVVYIRRNAQGKVIYVGSSLEGLGRPFGKQHEKAQLESVGETLEVYCLRSVPGLFEDWSLRRQIEALERYFVGQENPELNGKPWERLNAKRARQKAEKEAPSPSA